MNKIYTLSIALLLFSINWASAQCVSGNCTDGHGTWKWETGATYTGHFQNGTRSGYGQYTFSNGDVYVGEWQNNQKHGYGVYYYNARNKYKLYAGEWIADERSGMGIMHYEDKGVEPRFGIWKNNKYSHKYEDLGCLEGDCFTGFGIYVWNDGSRYEGNFKNGERNGEGIYYYPKGAKYVGNQVGGKRHGWGTYHYPSGSKYEGEWKQEVREGRGSMYAQGKLFGRGIWKDGKLIQPVGPEPEDNTDKTPPVITILTPKVEALRNGGIKIVVKDRIIQVEGIATDESGIARVRTNGSISELTDINKTKKRFIGQITLAKGQNRFWVEAEDKAGNKVKEEYQIEYTPELGLIVDKEVETISEKRTALVVGNAQYTNVPALRNPENDAVAMANRLQDLGFEVELKTNISEDEMVLAIKDYGERLKTNKGVGLFYYAGHGLQLNGQNYLVPVNADIRHSGHIETEAVDLKTVLNEIEYADNRLNIVILDACRDNPYGIERSLRKPGLNAVPNAPSGTYIAYSTSPSKAASDGSGDHGLYTEMLLRVLENSKGLKIEDVFKQVRIYVEDESEGLQTPWENSSLTGDFYFDQ